MDTLITYGNLARFKNNLMEIVSRTEKVAGTPSAVVTVEPYKVYEFGTVAQAMSVTLGTATGGYTADYTIRLVAGANCSVTLPSTCKYSGGNAPTYTFGRTYEINISDGLVVVGEFY